MRRPDLSDFDFSHIASMELSSVRSLSRGGREGGKEVNRKTKTGKNGPLGFMVYRICTYSGGKCLLQLSVGHSSLSGGCPKKLIGNDNMVPTQKPFCICMDLFFSSIRKQQKCGRIWIIMSISLGDWKLKVGLPFKTAGI